MKSRNHKKASVLILAIWTLMLLTTFAAYIGLRVRSRVSLLSRLEDRSRLHYAAEAGVKKAVAALRYDIERSPLGLSAEAKQYRFNNESLFGAIELPRAQARVGYYGPEATRRDERDFIYGVQDEERKVNINTADRETLMRLLGQLTRLSQAESEDVVDAIINWREIGNTELVGFASDEFYSNLPHPYLNKNAPFELFEELHLIKGVNDELYGTIRPFITIYGDGLVNINTAPKEVLIALGLEEAVADKLLKARRGPDGIEASADDHVFRNAYDVAGEVQELVSLEKEEVIQIDFLNGAGRIKTDSSYYLIQSEARLGEKGDRLEIRSVYNARDNVIEYWRENN